MLKKGLVLVILSFASIVACAHSPNRNEWRMQSGACASDADCGGGECVIHKGGRYGTCSGGAPLPLLPPGQGADGGARPPGPPPSPANAQPSSTDIHI